MVLSNIRLGQEQVSRSHVAEGAGPPRATCRGRVGEVAAVQAALWPATTVTFYIEVSGREVVVECSRSAEPKASPLLSTLKSICPPAHPAIHSPIHHPLSHAFTLRLIPPPAHPPTGAGIIHDSPPASPPMRLHSFSQSSTLILQAPTLCRLLCAALQTFQTEHLAHA